ncbi:hypothetical protein [Segeticoccus rhizosphaerae]|uniref:hypothetical protein n=1 Tax=Segeticoccus rhizosphaerae TaxID=1104777 RepID=UPI0010BFD984|nr:hypothetical protein [Ornithinicoccus soli]
MTPQPSDLGGGTPPLPDPLAEVARRLITAHRQVSAAQTAMDCTRSALTRLDHRMLEVEAASAKAHAATGPEQAAGHVAHVREQLTRVGRCAQVILPDARMIRDQLDRARSTMVAARGFLQQVLVVTTSTAPGTSGGYRAASRAWLACSR